MDKYTAGARLGCSPMNLCGLTESEQKADSDGNGVFLGVVGVVAKQQGNE